MPEYFYNLNFIQKILKNRRKKRALFVLSKVNVFPGMRILDVGCGPNGRSFEDFLDQDFKITGIDIIEKNKIQHTHPNFTYLKQNAQDLSMFNDNEFNLAVSFGMMEHICDKIMLKKIYNELNRVSEQWIIVVPWKYAPIEPHFKLPFFQLFPYFLKVVLTKILNLHNLRYAVTKDYYYIKKNYQWLTKKQWLIIFREGKKVYLTPHFDTIAIIKK